MDKAWIIIIAIIGSLFSFNREVTKNIHIVFLQSLLVVVVAVFDCLPHSLLTAKVHAYRFDKTSTEYLKYYLSHRKLKIKKIYKTFSNWTNILHVVPQGSKLGPLVMIDENNKT